MIRHAGLVAARLAGRWAGVLIEGPSGSGKSDLALRLMDGGFRLVADDRTLVWRADARLWGRAPEALTGLIEVRGVGILSVEPLAYAEIVMLARLGPAERLPDPAVETLLGGELPCLTLDPFERSAPVKLRRALETFDAGRKNAI